MSSPDVPDRSPFTTDDVASFLRRASLDPQQWDLPAIARKANTWAANNQVELDHIESHWPAEDKAAHRAEFGAISTVDFIEQCVIEAGPDAAPWSDLQTRVNAGEFDSWPPIWQQKGHRVAQSADQLARDKQQRRARSAQQRMKAALRARPIDPGRYIDL
ncbi:hypothetical protein ABQF35_28160 [Mycobacterium syngnathidarum]